MTAAASFTIAGLFAGVGGFERGFDGAGGQAKLLCEQWSPAQAVLAERFPGVPISGDIAKLDSLPDVDVVTAGFPCTDLSQAGRQHGITGEASGLVGEVFRVLAGQRVPVVVLENVRNMLVLDKGAAMRFLVDELEALGYQWAYRLVDSRFTGVPQRRQRVILVASREIDPCGVLFADDAGERPNRDPGDVPCGFSWTEGLRGLGWAVDAVPTLKGGSSLGIPSPPAIWNPNGVTGRRIVTPSVEEAEVLQGFPPGWTAPADRESTRKGTRWKMVGNAVTVGVARWVGERLVAPGPVVCATGERLDLGDRWPRAAYGGNGSAWRIDASMWPRQDRYRHLGDVVDLANAAPLSARATGGFHSRAERSTLRMRDEFRRDVALHARLMAEHSAAQSASGDIELERRTSGPPLGVHVKGLAIA